MLLQTTHRTMDSFRKLINSQDKRQIEFVALGNNQIEFFTLKSQRYFSIYRGSSEGEQGIIRKLSDCQLSQTPAENVNKHLSLKHKHTTIQIKRDDANNVTVTLYWWNWLPINSYRGKVSNLGWETVLRNIRTAILSE